MLLEDSQVLCLWKKKGKRKKMNSLEGKTCWMKHCPQVLAQQEFFAAVVVCWQERKNAPPPGTHQTHYLFDGEWWRYFSKVYVLDPCGILVVARYPQPSPRLAPGRGWESFQTSRRPMLVRYYSCSLLEDWLTELYLKDTVILRGSFFR